MTITADVPISVPTAAVPAPAAAPHRYRWLAYSAVLTATVMDLLDSTVVHVAAPSIQAELGGSYATVQWMAAGYTMALAVLLLVGGRLGDIVGRKRALLAGVGGFTLASLACAVAASPGMLIGSRVLQGAFAAIMLPQGFGLIRDLFPPGDTAKAWGVFGPVMGLSAVLGPIVGGALLDADLFGTGWRMIFLINLPVGAFTLYVAAKYLPSAPATAPRSRLDLPGVLLAAAGVFLLVYPLVQGRELGWPAWTFGMLAASVPVLAAFAVQQSRRRRTGRTGLIEPSVFAKRSYVSGVVFAVVFFAAMAGTFVLGIFLQVGLGYSPMRASLTMAPWAFGAFVGSAFGGMTMHRLGRRILHVGLVLMGAGLGVLYLVLQHAGGGVDQWDFVLPNLLGGIGMGMIFVPLFDIAVGGLDDSEVGSASGMLGAFEQLGIALGVAVIGTIFFSLLGWRAGSPVDGAVHAVGQAVLATTGLIAVAFVVGFLLPEKPRQQHG